jgi:transposase
VLPSTGICDVLDADPFSSHLFVFCNRLRDRIKIFYWHNNVFWLFYRRLEKQRFWWPTDGEQALIEITSREFSWLLERLDVAQARAHKTAMFSLF